MVLGSVTCSLLVTFDMALLYQGRIPCSSDLGTARAPWDSIAGGGPCHAMGERFPCWIPLDPDLPPGVVGAPPPGRSLSSPGLRHDSDAAAGHSPGPVAGVLGRRVGHRSVAGPPIHGGFLDLLGLGARLRRAPAERRRPLRGPSPQGAARRRRLEPLVDRGGPAAPPWPGGRHGPL